MKKLLITLMAIMLGILATTAIPSAHASGYGTGTLYMYSNSSCTILLDQSSSGNKGYLLPPTGTVVYIKITGISELSGSAAINVQFHVGQNSYSIDLPTTITGGSTDCVPWEVGNFGDGNTAVTLPCGETGNIGYGPAGNGNEYMTLSNGGSDGGHIYGYCASEEFPQPPSVSKDASGSYTTTYTWTIQKDVDKTLVKQVGGTVTFTYTITVTHDEGTDSEVKVTGTIDAINPNTDPLTADVTDKLSDGTTCTVTGGSSASLANGDNYFSYQCDLSAVPQSDLYNTATVTWLGQTLSNGFLAAGSASFTTDPITFTQTVVDECVSVDDSYAGHLGDVCVGDPNPKTFTYQRTVNVPQWDCVSYDNTATYTTDDTGATDSASQTVTVCGPVQTGALTMGFWKNKNGQDIIGSYCGGTSGTSLYTFLTGYAPFQDLTGSSCATIQTYVTGVINGASAKGASMNAMLKAQMLATALDVYFSDPALGGNKIGAPGPIGSVEIDLTQICKNIPTCTVYEDVSSAFGGASSLNVQEMLSYAASQSNSGGSTWYGNVKATQELAKDAFDAINNQVAFGVV